MFEPELGQIAFSGGVCYRVPMPPFVEEGLAELGELLVARGCCGMSPADNSGAEFENAVFAMRAYCWCDGDRAGHEAGCPPNFVCGDFAAAWYKWLGRGSSQNQVISPERWKAMLARCRESLE